METEQKIKKGIAFAILAAVLYAINAPFSKILLEFMPPTLMAGFLYVGAGIGMIFIALMRKIKKYEAKELKLTNNEPYEKRRLDISSKDSIPQDNVTKNIPNHNLVLIFSLNTIRAIIAVATISKLLSNDAFAAVVEFRPNSKQIGAAISKTIIAMVYGNSKKKSAQDCGLGYFL